MFYLANCARGPAHQLHRMGNRRIICDGESWPPALTAVGDEGRVTSVLDNEEAQAMLTNSDLQEARRQLVKDLDAKMSQIEATRRNLVRVITEGAGHVPAESTEKYLADLNIKTGAELAVLLETIKFLEG